MKVFEILLCGLLVLANVTAPEMPKPIKGPNGPCEPKK